MNREEKEQVEKEHGNPKLNLPLTVWITTNCGKSERDRNTRSPDLPLRNLYAGQEATVRTGHGTRDWFQIGK